MYEQCLVCHQFVDGHFILNVQRLEYREGSSEDDLDLEMMDTDELRHLVLDLKHDLELSKSEVDLFRKSASMSAKDFVQVCVRQLLSSRGRN